MGLNLGRPAADELHQITIRGVPAFFHGAKTFSDLSKDEAGRRIVVSDYMENVAKRLPSVDGLDAALALKWITCTFMGGGNADYETFWESVLYDLYWRIKRKEYTSVISIEISDRLKKPVSRYYLERCRVTESLNKLRDSTVENQDIEILSYYGPRETWDYTVIPYDVIDMTCSCALFRQFWRGFWEKGERELMDILYEYFRLFAYEKRIDSANPSLIHPPVIEGW